MFSKFAGSVLLSALAWTAPAHAGFNSWSAKTENDPFSGGTKVTANYASSVRSGVLIACDTAQSGMMVRTIPGFSYSDVLAGRRPLMEFAVDGKRLIEQSGETGSVGDNLAVAQVQLTHANAMALAEAFVKAKTQVAVRDGISDRPFLLRAAGSSKVGATLVKCLKQQAAATSKADKPSSDAEDDLLTPAGRFVKFKGMALAAQDKCKDYEIKPEALKPQGIDAAELATVEGNMLDGEKNDAIRLFYEKSCFAALREPLAFTSLGFDQVWQKK
ncbi:hypothetical protein [Agrobacterium sp. FDAARGOS_525]|uniref:hypothetical protein n=1 Tax=Agrobacterium sp. FDAARGOS_525 TaxID=2420311 RepID=UPI000F66DB11|nr:hypothetical protein [Agrobacterium sp. FDAARGOS_525]